MPRAGLDSDAVVTAAAFLADESGLGELTLAQLADYLGVRSPSLYVHIGGLDDLRTRLAMHGVRELTATLRSATAERTGLQALRALAHAYRSYASAHPGVYAAMQRAPGARPDPDPEFERVAGALVQLLADVLGGYGLHEQDAIHGVRMVRAALHGFVSLEQEGGFAMPIDVDDTYERLIDMLDRGLDRGLPSPP